MEKKLYSRISNLIQARKNCEKTENEIWFDNHTEELEKIEKQFLPSGSGFDSGTKIDIENSSRNKIILSTSFHAMDENGFYDGWYDFKITIKPDLLFGFTLSIQGKDYRKNPLKSYIFEIFSDILDTEI